MVGAICFDGNRLSRSAFLFGFSRNGCRGRGLLHPGGFKYCSRKTLTCVWRGPGGPASLSFIFILGLGFGRDPVLAARLMSLLISVLTLILFHLALRSFCSKKEALWSDLVLVLASFAVRYSVQAMTRSLFNFFLVTLLFFILKAQRTENLKWAVTSGLAAVGVYLTRVEGFARVLFIASGVLFISRLGFKFFRSFFYRVLFSAAFLSGFGFGSFMECGSLRGLKILGL